VLTFGVVKAVDVAVLAVENDSLVDEVEVVVISVGHVDTGLIYHDT